MMPVKTAWHTRGGILMCVKCPYCGQEMKKGHIYNGMDDVLWTPDGEKQSHIINRPHKYQILLSKRAWITANKFKVYRCPTCKIQVIFENDLTD